ncbi:hypothetical protein [Oceanobacillus sp. CAU 1775]
MESFELLCQKTSQELGRVLEEKEIKFLYWVFERHCEESKLKQEQTT